MHTPVIHFNYITLKSGYMRILVRYFAILRERKGIEVEEIVLDEQISVAQLYQMIFGQQESGIRFAVNQNYVESNHVLGDGDEVAFLPPLGGG